MKISATLNSNVFHVSKFIPYTTNKCETSSSSSSKSSSSFSDQGGSSSFSSLSSKTDSELEHVSTPSEKSSSSSREDNKNINENINKEKMEKKGKFSKVPLFLDDTKVGQGKHLHVIQLQSYRMSLLPYVTADAL